jgi:hypothetical protein
MEAAEDKNNPYYPVINDHRDLNRTEGYEVLYFINHFSDKILFTTNTTAVREDVNLHSLQNIEKMIRYHVPSNIRKREQTGKRILENWKTVI